MRSESGEILGAADKRALWHPFTQMRAWCAPEHEPLVLERGRGAVLWDTEGREYLDGNSSIWTNIHGHCHPHIVAAVRAQLETLDHVSFLGTSNIPAIRLAERLVALFPPGTLERVFYSDNGSTAVEVALKLALQYRQLTGSPRRGYAAFEMAYHGDTCGASSVGGVGTFHDRFANLQFDVLRLRDAEDLHRLDPSAAAELSAIVIEPLVQGAAGIRLWPTGMLRELRDWCDANDVLLIFDEVLTGFGRTGRMFACEHEGVLPDFLALAKGLTGGTLPLAATLTTERVFAAFLGEFEERKTFYYGHSYCGNPVACAAAIANLEIFENESVLASLPPKTRALSAALRSLETLPEVRSTRQIGLIAGIDLARADGSTPDWREQTGARVCAAAREHGLITRPILDTVVLMPPLCSTEMQIATMGNALKAAIEGIRTATSRAPGSFPLRP